MSTRIKITLTIEKTENGVTETQTYDIQNYDTLNLATNRVNKLLHLATFHPNIKIE